MTALRDLVSPSECHRVDRMLQAAGHERTFVPILDQWDFDTDELSRIAEEVRTASTTLRSGEELVSSVHLAREDCWEGETADSAEAWGQCVASWWQQILDFLLGIVDWLVQLVDYLLDILYWIAGMLNWALQWVAAVLSVIGLFGLPEGWGLVVEAIALVVEMVALASLLVAVIFRLVDPLVEWEQDLIRSGRDALCGGGVIPRSKDWDPGTFPIGWPF